MLDWSLLEGKRVRLGSEKWEGDPGRDVQRMARPVDGRVLYMKRGSGPARQPLVSSFDDPRMKSGDGRGAQERATRPSRRRCRRSVARTLTGWLVEPAHPERGATAMVCRVEETSKSASHCDCQLSSAPARNQTKVLGQAAVEEKQSKGRSESPVVGPEACQYRECVQRAEGLKLFRPDSTLQGKHE